MNFFSVYPAAKGFTSKTTKLDPEDQSHEEDMNPQRRDVLALLVQNQNDLMMQIHQMLARRRRRRRKRQRTVWVRDWINRRREHGLYDRLMVELRNEDTDECATHQ